MANKSFPGHSYIVSGCYQDIIGSSSIKKHTNDTCREQPETRPRGRRAWDSLGSGCGTPTSSRSADGEGRGPTGHQAAAASGWVCSL